MTTDKKDFACNSESVDIFDTDDYDMVSNDEILTISEELNLELPVASDKSLSNLLFSSSKHYEQEWNELYKNETVDLNKLQKISTDGQLRNSRFRSICWRCLLGILYNEPKQWLCQLKMYRKHYDEICVELEQNPWNIKNNKPYDNPLSQESDSIWQRYFCDEELKAVVHQDVKRTFPDMEFFRRKDIQEMMIRILFCYARQNPALCYRQGMHEILAPLIFIIHCDQQAFLQAREQIPNLDEDIYEILNPDYLEQDSYNIFKHIMNHIECSYRLNNRMTLSTENLCASVNSSECKTGQNDVLSRLDYIKKNILQPKDPKLSEHLHKLDIPLHLFGIRWLRLLFGREYPLQDLLVLWDFIFSHNFEIVNFIVVAMLVAIRDILLNADYTECLTNLMRYPSGVDVTFVINYSLHLKDPLQYSCPDTSKSFYHSRSVTTKPSTESENNISQLNRRLKTKPLREPRWFSEKPNLLLLGDKGDGSSYVVSGYSTNDPNVVKAELENTKTVLNVVHHKLLQFHSTLTANLQNIANAEVQATLDGMFELSCLVKSYVRENGEIETASEAGETKEPRNPSPPQSLTPKLKKLKPFKGSINSDNKSHTLPRTRKGLKSGELKVFKHHVGGALKGLPMTDPLHLIKNLIQDDCVDTQCK